MSFIFHPGNILVDDTDRFGIDNHDSLRSMQPGLPPSLPDLTVWQAQVRHWLDEVLHTRVGSILLNLLESRPAGIVVKIVWFSRVDEAWTDGLASTPEGPTVYVTYQPNDAAQGQGLRPMRHPGSVLAHELTHALLATHGFNEDIVEGVRLPLPIYVWNAPAYPSRKEFWATTVQNMLQSETGSLLADGYDVDADDPWIVTAPTSSAETTFGPAADSHVDLANFVASYRIPLEYLDSHLPILTTRLAALTDIPFNPFAFMRSSGGSGSGAAVGSGGASGAARRPGPIESTPQ